MDAPPPQEDVRPFVEVAALLAGCGLNAPRVLAEDREHGFLLLTDLGTRLYLDALNDAVARGRLKRRRCPDARRDRALVQAGKPTPDGCRPTTTRCCGASWRCSRTGAWRANAA